MIAERDKIFDAWQQFQRVTGGLKRPENELEYLDLLSLLEEMTDRFNCNEEPYASLFDLLSGYMDEWELKNDPELKDPTLKPFEMLAFYMDQRGISQYQLAQEGIVDQANLSKILAGKLGISKNLAKRLAAYFGVNIEIFI